MDWIEQGLTSPPTQYRLFGRQFYRPKDPTNSIKVLKEKLDSYSMEVAQNPPGASHHVTSEPLKIGLKEGMNECVIELICVARLSQLMSVKNVNKYKT